MTAAAKRLIDIAVSALILIAAAPIVLVAGFLIWRQDGASFLFVQDRVGKNGRPFKLYKLRSMTVRPAGQTSVDTTSRNDPRITAVGQTIRKWKIDELPQAWNVLKGDMSLVGPRPQILPEAARYTAEEQRLFTVKPGITDLASIVFFDLEEIAASQPDPNVAYHQLVRPWKSRLGLFYVAHGTLRLDVVIFTMTFAAFVARRTALRVLAREVARSGAGQDLVEIILRDAALTPAPPPGRAEIVTAAEIAS
ncbi:MAG: sugar transferase [Pseudomonadota bacterium]